MSVYNVLDAEFTEFLGRTGHELIHDRLLYQVQDTMATQGQEGWFSEGNQKVHAKVVFAYGYRYVVKC